MDAGKFTSKRSVSFDIKPSGAVDSQVIEDLTLNEYLAPAIRGFLKRCDSDTRREAIQSLLTQNGPVRVKRVEPLNLEAIREPLQIHLEYVVPNSFHTVAAASGEKSLFGSLPCAWETEYLTAQALDSRKTPFEIAMPKFVRSTLEIKLPPDYQLANLQQCSGTGQSKYRAWSSTATQTGHTVKIEYAARLVAGRHPASEYEAYYSDLNDAVAVLQMPVTLQAQAGSRQHPATSTAKRVTSPTLIR
jgi:hypothetical protein